MEMEAKMRRAGSAALLPGVQQQQQPPSTSHKALPSAALAAQTPTAASAASIAAPIAPAAANRSSPGPSSNTATPKSGKGASESTAAGEPTNGKARGSLVRSGTARSLATPAANTASAAATSQTASAENAESVGVHPHSAEALAAQLQQHTSTGVAAPETGSLKDLRAEQTASSNATAANSGEAAQTEDDTASAAVGSETATVPRSRANSKWAKLRLLTRGV